MSENEKEKMNNLIDEFVHKYGSIFQDVVKCAMRDDIQKIVEEAKKERDAKK